MTLKNHSDIVKVVKDYFRKVKNSPNLSSEAMLDFITEYLDASQSLPFSVADIWSLKEKYLKELHTIVREQDRISRQE